MYHVGDVNKARAMPQNTFKIASFSSTNDVFLFDYSKHSSKLNADGISRPQAVLRAHTDEGFALSWHPMQQGLLLTGAQDGQMCLWNLEKMPTNTSATTSNMTTNGIECNTIIEPVEIYHSERKLVDAVQWHPRYENNVRIMQINEPDFFLVIQRYLVLLLVQVLYSSLIFVHHREQLHWSNHYFHPVNHLQNHFNFV